MPFENIVKLDVGGAVFKTSKSTLTKFDGFFKTMLETVVPIPKDDSGAIFIDRDSAYFRLILNYMRDGDIDLQKPTGDVKEILKEAKVYGLEELVKMCSMEIENRKVVEASGKLEKIDIEDQKSESSKPSVKLNIGGTIFETSKSTLTQFDGYFKTMWETGVPITKDESGAVFIDRSPKHFDSILNFMRDGHLDLPESSEDVKQIQKEAQFYLLEGLDELCKSRNMGKFKVRHLENLGEELNAISTCEKKAVTIIYYHPGAYFYHLNQTLQILAKYGRFMDVFTKCRGENYSGSDCHVYDKTNNTSFTCDFYDWQKTFEAKLAHLL